MDCKQAKGDITQLVENTLPELYSQKLLIHINECSSCAKEYSHIKQKVEQEVQEEIQQIKQAFQSIKVPEIRDDFDATLQAKLNALQINTPSNSNENATVIALKPNTSVKPI
jgi:uncharacterized protein with von Willebrand factor type A (vWA) domain